MSFSKTLLVSLGLASLIACGTVSAAEKFGSDRHVARGVSCQMCHGPDMKNPQYPDENTCIKCHKKDSVSLALVLLYLFGYLLIPILHYKLRSTKHIVSFDK